MNQTKICRTKTSGFGILILVAAFAATDTCYSQSKGEYYHGASTSHWTAKENRDTSTYYEISGYAERPEDVTTYAVKFKAPKFDLFGNICELKGRLTYWTDEKPEQPLPVNWFQGIAVCLATKPGAAPDWSKSIGQTDVVTDSVILNNDGTFSIKLDMRETERDPAMKQEFQIGIALAQHKMVGEKGATQKVTWSSKHAAHPKMVQRISIPASAHIEPELRLMDQASGWPFSDPDGTKLIRAVNALQPLGKKKALEMLRTYLKHTEDEGVIVFWVIRVLFEPANLKDRIPPAMIAVYLGGRGERNDEAAAREHAKRWPLDPIEVVDGIPLMVGRQIGMSGRPEYAGSHILWAEKYGVIRDKKIFPTTNPLAAAEKLLTSKKLQTLSEYSRKEAVSIIRLQAFFMAGLIQESGERRSMIKDQEWRQKLKSKSGRSVWDAKKQQFVRSNKDRSPAKRK